MSLRLDNYQILLERLPDGFWQANIVGGVIEYAPSGSVTSGWHTERFTARHERPELAVALALGEVDRAWSKNPRPPAPRPVRSPKKHKKEPRGPFTPPKAG